MANSRLNKLGIARGSPDSEQELALITGPQGKSNSSSGENEVGWGWGGDGRETPALGKARGGEGQMV